MESNKEEKIKTVSEENIYKLNGRVPLKKAIPFGLQHVLAMFVSNLAPVLIVCSAAVLRSNGAHLSSAEITQLLQCAMFVAGIGTCLQLYPIGVIGSGLPIIMGVSFTFLEVCWSLQRTRILDMKLWQVRLFEAVFLKVLSD